MQESGVGNISDMVKSHAATALKVGGGVTFFKASEWKCSQISLERKTREKTSNVENVQISENTQQYRMFQSVRLP